MSITDHHEINQPPAFMSVRKLGGGRVLGSGSGLTPPQLPPSASQQHRPSPSASTLSSTTSATAATLATPPLHDLQDLSSQVSLEHGTVSAAAAAATSRLFCPICEEEMMTLLQLNRHLDDNHRELPSIEQDEIKNWFDRQVLKAKKFQPLAVINQKLKGLDVFESNDAQAVGGAAAQGSRISSPEPPRLDPDEVVTRGHWQRPGFNDVCTEPACGKRLGAVNGSVNCRKCGKVFCEEHTMYQMKLSRSAQHEPVRGFWCRVCETCYKSRDGYNDHHGAITDHTAAFAALRRKTLDKTFLEVSRLEKRLTKLTNLLAHTIEENSSGAFASLAGQKKHRKAIEQSVVTWEEDTTVQRCPFCQQEFRSWSFRKHHCRICGRVVCADPRTACSTEVGLSVHASEQASESHEHQRVTSDSRPSRTLDVRMCITCRHVLFSHADFTASVNDTTPSQRAYENLLQFERGIRLLLPNFHRLLLILQDPNVPPSAAQLAEASKVRKRLIDSFGKYDLAAKRLRDLPSTSPTQQRLQKAIYIQSSNFLHLHMLPLKSLPKILKHATPSPLGSTNSVGSGKALASIKLAGTQSNGDSASASQISESSTTALSQMEGEERALKERLIVLEEQRFMVQEMLGTARKGRRFDEVAALKGNLEEIEREISRVNGEVAQLDWPGAYSERGDGVGGDGGVIGGLRDWIGLR